MKKILLLGLIASFSNLFGQTVSVDNPTPGEVATYTFTYVTANTIGGTSADENLTLLGVSVQSAFSEIMPVFDSMDSLAAHVSVKIDGADEPVTEDNFSAMLSGVSIYGVQLSLRSTGNFVMAGSEVEIVISGVFVNSEIAGPDTVVWTTNKGTGEVVETFTDVTTFGFSSLQEVPSNGLNLSLYPNPAQNTIQLTGFDDVQTYVIYNSAGIEVQRGAATENEVIDVAYLSDGMYFVKVNDSQAIKFIKRN